MSEHVPDPGDREPLARPATWTALATALVVLVSAVTTAVVTMRTRRSAT